MDSQHGTAGPFRSGRGSSAIVAEGVRRERAIYNPDRRLVRIQAATLAAGEAACDDGDGDAATTAWTAASLDAGVGAAVTQYRYSFDDPATTRVESFRHSVTTLAGHTTTYSYDGANRLAAADTRDAAGVRVDYAGYGYDLNSNRTSVRAGSPTGPQTSYSYDNADQLTDASDGSSWGYDPNGNQTAKTTAAGTSGSTGSWSGRRAARSPRCCGSRRPRCAPGPWPR